MVDTIQPIVRVLSVVSGSILTIAELAKFMQVKPTRRLPMCYFTKNGSD